MSSTALKKTKKLSKTKTKQLPTADDVVLSPAPASISKERKAKQAKVEEHVHKTKTKTLFKEGTKRTKQDAKRVTRPARKGPGPWKLPSPSPSPSPPSDFEPSQSEEDGPEGPQEESISSPDEENVHLYGFSTDEDSSDDDVDVDEGPDFDVGTLPTVARDDATVKRKLEKARRKSVRVSLPVLLAPPPRHTAYYECFSGDRDGCSLSWPDSPRLL